MNDVTEQPGTPAKRLWEARRDKAIKRFVKSEQSGDTSDTAETFAVDAIVVAHLAATSEFNAVPNRWTKYEAKAIKDFVAASQEYEESKNPAAHEKLKAALDVLAVAHTAATFEWTNGTLKW